MHSCFRPARQNTGSLIRLTKKFGLRMHGVCTRKRMGGKKILTALAAAAAAWCRGSGYSFQPSAVRRGCGGGEDGNGERTRSFLSSPESELLLDAPLSSLRFCVEAGATAAESARTAIAVAPPLSPGSTFIFQVETRRQLRRGKAKLAIHAKMVSAFNRLH
jgi:hypothetical protein